MQRVAHARVLVDGEIVGRCGRGLLVLLGVMRGDGESEARRLAQRIGSFRCFEDADGRMNESLVAVHGAALVVSQFTLAADGRKGRRPSFDRAAIPEVARPLCETFATALEALGIPTERGVFGAKMVVELVNEGPVTFVLDEAPQESA